MVLQQFKWAISGYYNFMEKGVFQTNYFIQRGRVLRGEDDLEG